MDVDLQIPFTSCIIPTIDATLRLPLRRRHVRRGHRPQTLHLETDMVAEMEEVPNDGSDERCWGGCSLRRGERVEVVEVCG
ncbi:hypothetical protein C2S52_004970 [Perilla frutescens var. hirtella]|nr:hypothetical protein C2S52_004970 [Perilla frutescens var. hirtella]